MGCWSGQLRGLLISFCSFGVHEVNNRCPTGWTMRQYTNQEWFYRWRPLKFCVSDQKIKNGLDESGPRARRPLVGPVLTALSSHRFFKARLRAGSSLEDLLIQIGHLFVGSALHQLFRQPLQNLWLRDRRTGSVKMLWHTGQWRSSSDLEAIEFLSEAENWKYSQSWLFSLLLT